MNALRARNKALRIASVIAFIGGIPTGAAAAKHTPNRRVIRTFKAAGNREVSFHATKGWRVVKVAA